MSQHLGELLGQYVLVQPEPRLGAAALHHVHDKEFFLGKRSATPDSQALEYTVRRLAIHAQVQHGHGAFATPRIHAGHPAQKEADREQRAFDRKHEAERRKIEHELERMNLATVRRES